MDNFKLMRKRLECHGGVCQEDRMIKDKYRSLQKALLYSYQSCVISKVQPFDTVVNEAFPDASMAVPSFPDYRALINPDKLKQDYDDKILSVNHEYGFSPGDVFEWRRTNTKWIIYTTELTEDAYFRGAIRRCKHKIKFKDKDGNWCSTWAAIRGPVETVIDSIQKNQVRIDRPNLSLNILIPQNEKTLYAFDRYSEFLFAGKCWKVEAHDTISMENIIEISAQEDYINQNTDDEINEIKNGLVIEQVIPETKGEINGATFIKPQIKEYYTSSLKGTWIAVDDNDKEVPVTICQQDDYTVSVIWTKMTSGHFRLICAMENTYFEKYIVVESLF